MNKLYKLTLIGILIIPLSSIFPHLLKIVPKWQFLLGMAGTDVWYIQLIFLLIFISLGLSTVLWKFNKFVSIFTVSCMFSTLLMRHQDIRDIMALFVVQCMCLLAYGISKMTRGQRVNILRAIVLVFIAQSALVIAQYFNADPFFDYIGNTSMDDTVGLVGSHNQVGLFLADVGPLIVIFYPYFIPILIFCLWCSTTSSAWAGCIVASLLAAFYIGKRKFVFLFALFLICTGIYVQKFESVTVQTFKERARLVEHTVRSVLNEKIVTEVVHSQMGLVKQVITCNQFFGFGLGKFIRISPRSEGQYWVVSHDKIIEDKEDTLTGMVPQHRYSHAHNDYAEVFFEMGWFGIIALVLCIGDFIRRFIVSKKSKLLIVSFSCVVAHLVTALGIFTVHTAVSGLMLILFWGITEGELREVDNGETWWKQGVPKMV